MWVGGEGCVGLGGDENVRGEVTFSWVNGMTAISFKSFREGPEQQNNYVTPNWSQRKGARETQSSASSSNGGGVKCWETMQLILHYIHYRCQAAPNASPAELITMYAFPVTYTTLITGPFAWLSTMSR